MGNRWRRITQVTKRRDVTVSEKLFSGIVETNRTLEDIARKERDKEEVEELKRQAF